MARSLSLSLFYSIGIKCRASAACSSALKARLVRTRGTKDCCGGGVILVLEAEDFDGCDAATCSDGDGAALCGIENSDS